MLIGAVDTVLALANQGPRAESSQPSLQGNLSQPESSQSSLHGSFSQPGSSQSSLHGSLSQPGSSQSSLQGSFSQPGSSQSSLQGSSSKTSRAGQSAGIEEHRRLFNYRYRPSKDKRPYPQRKGRRKGATWKKDCICLRDREQSWRPSSEEKIELARMGLGLKVVVFKSDGDAEHIHRALLDTFPVLEECGGYTLLRLAENSHNMVEIEGPEGGMTVSYLKDILNQAKLYVRPLQKDITDEDMKPYCTIKVNNFDLVELPFGP